MKRLPLLSLSLVAALGVGCSNPSQQDALSPTEHMQVKKRAQALTGVTLHEVPVSAEVLAATEGEATVRAFRNWFQMTAPDVCSHGDFYGLVFREAGLVFVIEATGSANC